MPIVEASSESCVVEKSIADAQAFYRFSSATATALSVARGRPLKRREREGERPNRPGARGMKRAEGGEAMGASEWSHRGSEREGKSARPIAIAESEPPSGPQMVSHARASDSNTLRSPSNPAFLWIHRRLSVCFLAGPKFSIRIEAPPGNHPWKPPPLSGFLGFLTE